MGKEKTMLEILSVILFCWLFFKGLGLAFKLTWCAAKVVAVILVVLSLPALIVGLLFAGGMILLLPIVMIAVACGLLKSNAS